MTDHAARLQNLAEEYTARTHAELRDALRAAADHIEAQAKEIARLEAEMAELQSDRRALVSLIYARDGIVTQDAIIEDGAS